MRFCEKCGTILNGRPDLCNKCGERLDKRRSKIIEKRFSFEKDYINLLKYYKVRLFLFSIILIFSVIWLFISIMYSPWYTVEHKHEFNKGVDLSNKVEYYLDEIEINDEKKISYDDETDYQTLMKISSTIHQIILVSICISFLMFTLALMNHNKKRMLLSYCKKAIKITIIFMIIFFIVFISWFTIALNNSDFFNEYKTNQRPFGNVDYTNESYSKSENYMGSNVTWKPSAPVGYMGIIIFLMIYYGIVYFIETTKNVKKDFLFLPVGFFGIIGFIFLAIFPITIEEEIISGELSESEDGLIQDRYEKGYFYIKISTSTENGSNTVEKYNFASPTKIEYYNETKWITYEMSIDRDNKEGKDYQMVEAFDESHVGFNDLGESTMIIAIWGIISLTLTGAFSISKTVIKFLYFGLIIFIIYSIYLHLSFILNFPNALLESSETYKINGGKSSPYGESTVEHDGTVTHMKWNPGLTWYFSFIYIVTLRYFVLCIVGFVYKSNTIQRKYGTQLIEFITESSDYSINARSVEYLERRGWLFLNKMQKENKIQLKIGIVILLIVFSLHIFVYTFVMVLLNDTPTEYAEDLESGNYEEGTSWSVYGKIGKKEIIDNHKIKLTFEEDDHAYFYSSVDDIDKGDHLVFHITISHTGEPYGSWDTKMDPMFWPTLYIISVLIIADSNSLQSLKPYGHKRKG